jgi:hypothetical protein
MAQHRKVQSALMTSIKNAGYFALATLLFAVLKAATGMAWLDVPGIICMVATVVMVIIVVTRAVTTVVRKRHTIAKEYANSEVTSKHRA